MQTVQEMPKACVILGAGASKAIDNGSAQVLNHGNYEPPLASELFANASLPHYSQLLNPYPGARAVASYLSPMSGQPTFALETELRSLSEDPDPRIRQQFKHVPPYLRDLLWRASYEYTKTPGTYMQLLRALLAGVPHHVLFLVLNYDTLLEQALDLFELRVKTIFENIDSYVEEDRQFKVVKLHGSIDWFKLIGSAAQTWEDLVESQDVLQRTADDAIYIENTQGPLQQVMINRNLAYPILTAPLAGKGIADMVCPTAHIQVAKDFLKLCRKYLIIGTSGWDEDLLALLDEAVHPSLHPTVQLVGLRDADEGLQRFERGVTAFRGRRETPPGFLFQGGLRQYSDSGELAKFTEFEPRR